MRIGIMGCCGKMGQMLIKTAEKIKGADIVAACDSQNSPYLDQDAGEVAGIGKNGVNIISDPTKLFAKSEIVIDFSQHTASTKNAVLAVAEEKPIVIGTTGFTDEELETIKEAATKTPILLSPNMSIGINILLSIIEKTAAILDNDYDIEVLEMHHRAKVDAPSGTAMALGKAAAKGRRISLDEAIRAERFGNIGKRLPGEIGFATLRGGDVVGDHTVIFAGDGERIEFSHKATSREVFAVGAYRAAFWLINKPAGLYSIKDILNL